MDWIEKKAEQERILDNAAPRLWAYLCDALRHAVESYNKHYANPLAPALFNTTPYSSVYIQTTRATGLEERTIRPDKDFRNVEIIKKDKTFRLSLQIDESTGEVMLSNGKDQLTVEEASRCILEPMLDFGKPHRRPQ